MHTLRDPDLSLAPFLYLSLYIAHVFILVSGILSVL